MATMKSSVHVKDGTSLEGVDYATFTMFLPWQSIKRREGKAVAVPCQY